MSDEAGLRGAADTAVREVHVRCTGHVRAAVDAADLEYEFEGETLGDFLSAFFDDWDVRDMLIAETESEATTRGWAPDLGDISQAGTAKNPEGEQTRRYARVTVNGVFNEHLDGLETPLETGDRVALMYPFIYCC